MPKVPTVFGFEVDVDNEEAEVLRRQGLIPDTGPVPTEETVAPAAGFQTAATHYAAADFEVSTADQAGDAGPDTSDQETDE